MHQNIHICLCEVRCAKKETKHKSVLYTVLNKNLKNSKHSKIRPKVEKSLGASTLSHKRPPYTWGCGVRAAAPAE